MISTSTEYKTAILAFDRVFKTRVTIGTTVCSDESIKSINIEDALLSSEGFSIGGTASQKLTISLIGVDVNPTIGIQVEQGLLVNGQYEYIQLGLFNIDELEKKEGVVDIVAYDNMLKLDSPYTPDTTATIAYISAIVDDICRQAGITFSGNLPYYTINVLSGYTKREMIGFIACLCGGNAKINREGKLIIKTIGSSVKTITPAHCFSYKVGDSYKLDKISCKVDEETELTKGELTTASSRELKLTNPLMSAPILDNLYEALKGYTYEGFELDWKGDTALEVGDIITITDIKGVSRQHPIFTRSFILSGGLKATEGAKAETQNSNSFDSKGSFVQQVERQAVALAVVDKALITKASITDLDATNARVNNLEAFNADIENLIADKADITALNASNARIEDLEAINADIDSLIADKASIADLTASNARIKTLEADYASVNTLVAKKANITDLNATNASIESLEADVASVESLIADKASIAQLNASNAKITALEADVADVEELVADKASIAQLTASNAKITTLEGNYASLNTLVAKKANITDLEASNAKITTLETDMADVEELIAKKANITDLTASNGKITTLESNYASLNTLVAKKANITDLTASNARITTLETDMADVEELVATKATISDLNAVTAKVTTLEGDYGDIEILVADKASIAQLNAVDAKFSTVVINGKTQIADASITDAKIVSITANKLTAGKIDAGEIEVVNLNASNITVGTINGVQISNNAIDWSKLSSAVQGNITTAQSTAETALTSADGKNTVIYASSQPSSTGRKTGDTWFNTADGNKIYRWSGTAWTLTQFGAGAIGNNAITEAQIATAVNQKLADAFGTANTAKATADTAKTTADTAKTTAEQAQSTAGTAKTTAEEAQATADTATTTADTAKTTATTAKATADTAKATAETATTKADNAQATANTATTKADNAQASANTAQTTANGKNTVFYASSQPSTTSRKEGDIWFNTADGNKISRWNGTAWALAQFGTNAIASLSITNALIAEGTIQNAKIANLDAGKITTGYISADRIKADTITASHIAGKTITASEIVAGAITATSGIIANGAILTAMIGDAQITNAKISALDAGKITTGTLDAGRISAGAITTGHLASESITTAKIASNAILAKHITAETITGDKLVVDTITAREIASKTITANEIATNTITATSGVIANLAITNAMVASIDAGKITTGTLDAGRIATGSIVIGKLATTLQTTINDTASIASLADTKALMARGKILYPDVDFAKGTNSTTAYSGATTDTMTRVASAGGNPTFSGYMLEFNITGRDTSNRAKGWMQLLNSRANAIFIIRFVAKLPVGYEFMQYNNAMGTGAICTWLTSKDGTGNWQEYVYMWKCGSTGEFSSGGHIAVLTKTGTTFSAFKYHLASLESYDVTSASQLYTWMASDTTSIDGGKIYTGSIKADAIEANTITAGKIASRTITADRIVAGAITANEIASRTITANRIVAGAITANEIASRTITADRIVAGTITANEILTGTITSDKITSRTITADRIKAGVITANEIATRTISADRIIAGAITANEIASGTITADRLKAGTITATSGVIGSLDASKITTGTLSATLIKGGVLKLGGASNGNGLFEIYNASGGRIGSISNTGIFLTSGSFNIRNEYVSEVIPSRVTVQDFSFQANGIYGKYLNHDTSIDARAEIDLFEGLRLSAQGGLVDNTYLFRVGPAKDQMTTGDHGRTLIDVNSLDLEVGTGRAVRIDNDCTIGIAHRVIFTSNSYPHICGNGNYLQLSPNSLGSSGFVLDSANNSLRPSSVNGSDLGTDEYRWNGIASRSLNIKSTGNPYIELISTNGGLCYIDFSGSASRDFDCRIISQGTTLEFKGALFSFGGALTATSKSAITETLNYGEIITYCDESPNHVFTDRGAGVLDENGECYVFFDEVYTETVNTFNLNYWVQLTGIKTSNVYVEEQQGEYMLIKGEPNRAFYWQVTAERLGTEYLRWNEATGLFENGTSEADKIDKEAQNDIQNS